MTGLRVIGAGFGRTGTLSLRRALDDLGYGPTYHGEDVLWHWTHVRKWQRYAATGTIDWDELFAGYGAAVDFPVSCAWRDLAATFGPSHDNYQEIGIGPTSYRDYNAALWEFRYGSSPPIHAANLGFVTGGRGYALLFTAPEDQWAAQQGTAEQFRQAFQPVPQ